MSSISPLSLAPQPSVLLQWTVLAPRKICSSFMYLKTAIIFTTKLSLLDQAFPAQSFILLLPPKIKGLPGQRWGHTVLLRFFPNLVTRLQVWQNGSATPINIASRNKNASFALCTTECILTLTLTYRYLTQQILWLRIILNPVFWLKITMRVNLPYHVFT